MGDEERGVLEIGEVEEGTTHLARSMTIFVPRMQHYSNLRIFLSWN